MGVTLKITSAIAVDGVVVKAGEVREFSDGDARSLLHRGKAVLATADDEPKQADKVAEPAPAEVDQPAVEAQEDTPAAKPKKAK